MLLNCYQFSIRNVIDAYLIFGIVILVSLINTSVAAAFFWYYGL